MSSKVEPPDANPYLASEVTEGDIDPLRHKQPGPVAIFLSVIAGVVVACLSFGVAFFVTCLGVAVSGSQNHNFGAFLIYGISALTGIATFVFTTWGFLKIVRAMKR